MPSFFTRMSDIMNKPRHPPPPATGHDTEPPPSSAPSSNSYPEAEPTNPKLHRATQTLKFFALLTSFFLFIPVIFLILIEIGSTSIKPVLTSIWFIKLDLSAIVPTRIPNSLLLNTIARTLGLHDFYQVGLWGFCEGYSSEGVTFCSKPQTLYWFNPVETLGNELLAGATIALPREINDALDLLKLASQSMFAFFLTGACLSTVLMFIVPISIYSRWATLSIAMLTLINAILITIASVLGTVMFVIIRNVVTGVSDINIGAQVGTTMFALMWMASAFAIFAWLIQTGLCCCGASRRHVESEKKRGSKHARYNADAASPMSEKQPRRRFGFGKR